MLGRRTRYAEKYEESCPDYLFRGCPGSQQGRAAETERVLSRFAPGGHREDSELSDVQECVSVAIGEFDRFDFVFGCGCFVFD